MQDSICVNGNHQHAHVLLVSIVHQTIAFPFNKGYLLTVDATSGVPLDINAVGQCQGTNPNQMNPQDQGAQGNFAPMDFNPSMF